MHSAKRVIAPRSIPLPRLTALANMALWNSLTGLFLIGLGALLLLVMWVVSR